MPKSGVISLLFRGAFVATALAAIFAARCITRAEEPKRPNVLWLIADDHAAYVTGCYGNDIVRTPNIDRLAAEGVRFDRAYCNSPICTASRQSFITGRYPRSVGVTLLHTPLPKSALTIGEMLADAGYETAAIGKMHFNSNLTHGFQTRIDNPQWRAWLNTMPQRPLPPGVEVQPPWKPFRDPARIWLNAACLPYGAWDAEMSGTFFAQKACEFLAQKHQRPFFLIVSFYEPHSPFRFPVEYRGRHSRDEFDVYRVGPEDDDQIPDIFRDLTPDEKRGINAAYYTSVEFMDKNVGLVLNTLSQAGLDDDTLVVYIGDHGYMLGQHGRFEKHCSYEPADAAPLIMRYPKLFPEGRSTQAFVEFIDIVPTILDVCGVPVPDCVQGKSLIDVATGKTDKHREYVIVSYAHNDEIMIRDERYKLVYFRGKRVRDDGYDPKRPLPGPTIKLFDLEEDPGEFVNVAHKPEHRERIERFLHILADHIRETCRNPDALPKTDDPSAIIEYGVQPHDVQSVDE
ncbi:choline-sulfatase [Thermostilla marina]